MVGVYYTLPDQGEKAGEELFLQLQEESHLQATILTEDFSHMDVCWENGTANWKAVQVNTGTH